MKKEECLIDFIKRRLERNYSQILTSAHDYKTRKGVGHHEIYNYRKKYYDDDEVKIIRTKRFGIKPMDPEEACVQMELLGHNFYVFFNSETEEVNVVYKRKGNTYGLIEPELD